MLVAYDSGKKTWMGYVLPLETDLMVELITWPDAVGAAPSPAPPPPQPVRTADAAQMSALLRAC